MSVKTFVVPEDATPERADKLLAGNFPETSRSAIRRAMESGKIRRSSGELLHPKNKLNPGDELLVDLSTDPVPILRPVDLSLQILHEDDDLIVVNKSSGMVVHPGGGTGENTLVHALLHHCDGELSSVGAPDRPGIVHRLDKETSGVIVVAKTDPAHHALASQFAERETGKEYLALVESVPREESGSVTLPICRHPTVRVKMAVLDHGKPAHTDWKVAETFGDLATLLRCRIHTGRTHQIRVHLAYLGHPILGDETYGYKPSRVQVPVVPRVLLHAQRLSFTHPDDGQPITCEAPIPQDFSDYLTLLRSSPI